MEMKISKIGVSQNLEIFHYFSESQKEFFIAKITLPHIFLYVDTILRKNSSLPKDLNFIVLNQIFDLENYGLSAIIKIKLNNFL